MLEQMQQQPVAPLRLHTRIAIQADGVIERRVGQRIADGDQPGIDGGLLA